jgi:methionyl-tRNA synthetase
MVTLRRQVTSASSLSYLMWWKQAKCIRRLSQFPHNVSRRENSTLGPSPSSSVFITTPIFYVNAEPHIGHLYSAVIADTYHRYCKINGVKKKEGRHSIFSTGTDEHGMKIEKAAKVAGKTDVLLHCDQVSSRFHRMCEEFSVDCTDFVRTTEGRHRAAVQHFWVGIIKVRKTVRAGDRIHD